MKPEQITAWALDEASAEERQQLEAALLENPTAKQTAESTKEFCHFLLAELRDDSLALTDAQRDRLKAQAAGQSSRLTDVAVLPARQTKWRTGLVRLAIAACVVLGGFWTWHAYSLKQTASEIALTTDIGIKVNLPKATSAPHLNETESLFRLGTETTKHTRGAEEQLKAVIPKPLTQLSGVDFDSPQLPQHLGLKDVPTKMTEGDVSELKKIQDQAAYGLSFDQSSKSPVTPQPGLIASSGGNGSMTTGFATVGTLQAPAQPVDVAGVSALTKAGEGSLTLSSGNTFTGGTTVNAGDLLTINGRGGSATAFPSAGRMAGGAGGYLDLNEPAARPGVTAIAGNDIS
ncbi:autotransporter-associated beta strand repeat-containing protein, partial [Prosthecobacter sp.]|uniref:autotransporter-associated beta strand repeat-containing protein n=1 Tax=Prosthecobacter sp. TaxID=1965333 RepID=UPI001E02C6A0